MFNLTSNPGDRNWKETLFTYKASKSVKYLHYQISSLGRVKGYEKALSYINTENVNLKPFGEQCYNID